MASLRKRIEDKTNRKLTNRQITFAKLITEGIYSNAECARKSGYSVNVAKKTAYELLNGKNYPHVCGYISELREEKEKKYDVTLMGQLERLYHLSRGAEEGNQFSAAINAEKIRSSLAGLTVDRRESVHTLDQLSRDEITSRLLTLQKKYPQAFVIDAEVIQEEKEDRRDVHASLHEETNKDDQGFNEGE